MYNAKNVTDYEINAETLMIAPILVGEKVFSSVLEVDDEFIVEKSPLKIIDHTCKYFGSSFQGRMRGSQSLLKIHHKVPVAIDYHMGLFMFPTASPQRDDCIWMSLDSIVGIRKLDYNCSLISFRNRTMKRISVSPSIIHHQMLRTAMLKNKLAQNFEDLSRSEKKPLIDELVSETAGFYKTPSRPKK